MGASYLVKDANTTQGASAQTAITATIAGPVPAGYWPVATASVNITKTSGGTKTVWLSDPLSAGFTISGTVTAHLWGLESASAANAGYSFNVYRWAASCGCVVSALSASASGASAEWTTSSAVNATPPTITATSTNFVTGDRLFIVIFNIDAGGTQTASSRTMTVNYNGATGVSGDSYITFGQTLTFVSDFNNQPARGVSQ